MPLPSAAIGDCLDRLSDSLVFVSPKGDFQAQFSGLADFEIYLIDQNPPGLIFPGDDIFFNPRLTLFLDTFVGDDLYGFAKFRFDRGFDPGYMEEGDARADEYFLRYSPGSGSPEYSGRKIRHNIWKLGGSPRFLGESLYQRASAL